MDPFWLAVTVAIAGPVGAAGLLLLSLMAAAAIADRINPSDRPDVAEEAHEEEEVVEHASRAGGADSIDSTHISFPAFGIVSALMLILQTWGAATGHIDDPGEGPPLALALQPLWISVLAGLLVALMAGFYYRRWYRKQSWQRRQAIDDRRRSARRR